MTNNNEPRADPRTDPIGDTDERTTLVEFLDWYRATLLVKVAGLTDEQARLAAAPPSSLNLLGLVRHMAEVERSWFRRRFVGENVGPIFPADDDPDIDLHPPVGATVAEAVDVLQAEIELARLITDAADLDQLGVNMRDEARISMRWILVHMIEEYARHCGHADLLREAIDGEVGD